MRWTTCVLAIACAGTILGAAQPGDKADYLTKDGMLKEAVEVRELQGGFAGFSGTYYAVEPNGAWSTGPVNPRKQEKGAAKASGKLSGEQLAGLAKDLARYDLATLPNHGQAETNPKVVQIHFGKKVAELQPKQGKATEAEDKAVRARYQGIVEAVKALCKEPDKK